MPEYLAPGVYIEETSFRAKTIEGVSTSTAGFVGLTERGPTQAMRYALLWTSPTCNASVPASGSALSRPPDRPRPASRAPAGCTFHPHARRCRGSSRPGRWTRSSGSGG